jgi:hypothetical protein
MTQGPDGWRRAIARRPLSREDADARATGRGARQSTRVTGGFDVGCRARHDGAPRGRPTSHRGSIADPPIGRHLQSLTNPAAGRGPVNGLVHQLGRQWRPVRGACDERAAPAVPRADLRSLPLAAIVAAHPRRDPQPQALEHGSRSNALLL